MHIRSNHVHFLVHPAVKTGESEFCDGQAGIVAHTHTRRDTGVVSDFQTERICACIFLPEMSQRLKYPVWGFRVLRTKSERYVEKSGKGQRMQNRNTRTVVHTVKGEKTRCNL
jgi:hypothetical protein